MSLSCCCLLPNNREENIDDNFRFNIKKTLKVLTARCRILKEVLSPLNHNSIIFVWRKCKKKDSLTFFSFKCMYSQKYPHLLYQFSIIHILIYKLKIRSEITFF